ncbi:hypothetical protein DPD56_20595 [Salmonella enterica subsp. diarizonae]|nr:hypothetical protein [Salmonella enterica subsp. enterica serovar Enteritidis]ECC9067011.1 hypothetical protein [Salmonella enterica subsp. diarizonae]
MPAISDGVSVRNLVLVRTEPCALKSARTVLRGLATLRHILLTDKQREKLEKILLEYGNFA